ncbi:MAG TPA: quinolinate synthase NadA [bacterium (Candidatus Stahlbacteria)]|nr:quinolinate synthase NadA [Candidatus Stahlbacteria bacterium]
MSKNELRQEIMELKKAKNAVILVHNYQIPEIQEIADFFGDSLELSKIAAELDAKIIVFCGVHFMAETAKILSPDKMVLLPRKDAGCPMADMVDAESLRRLKAQYPDAEVVTYVNTTAEVKAESDVCCTSANAIKVVQNVESQRIIFVPDKNLANYVARFVDKEIIPWDGYCYVHQKIDPIEVIKAKQMNDGAKVIVHPECTKEVIDLADEVLSTSGMIRFAKNTSAKIIIVGTEEGLLYRLKKQNPDKIFYTAGPAQLCRNMKLTTLEDVYLALKEEKYKIEVPESIRKRAKIALDRMLEYV